MDDLKDRFHDAGERIEVPGDAYEHFSRELERRGRAARVTSTVVGLVITGALISAGVVTLLARGGPDGSTPISQPSGARSAGRTAIAFEKQLGEKGGIAIVAGKGAAPATIVEEPKGGTVSAFSASQDGTRIAFSKVDPFSEGGVADREHLFVAASDGSDRQVIYTPDPRLAPPVGIVQTAWAPNGETLGFVLSEWDPTLRSEGSETRRLWTVPTDGSGPARPITPAGDRVDSFAWSPDGSQVVLSMVRSGSSGSNDLWTMDLEDGSMTRVVDLPTDDVYPSWSPDTTQIVFTALDSEAYRSQIFSVDVATGRTWKVTSDSAGRDWAPQWSADGSQIAFERIDDDGCGLWVVDAVGEGQAPRSGAPWFENTNPDHFGGTWCPAANMWVIPPKG